VRRHASQSGCATHRRRLPGVAPCSCSPVTQLSARRTKASGCCLDLTSGRRRCIGLCALMRAVAVHAIGRCPPPLPRQSSHWTSCGITVSHRVRARAEREQKPPELHYYRLLGVASDAPVAAITKAYRQVGHAASLVITHVLATCITSGARRSIRCVSPRGRIVELMERCSDGVAWTMQLKSRHGAEREQCARQSCALSIP
jgi:hypothetical protein